MSSCVSLSRYARQEREKLGEIPLLQRGTRDNPLQRRGKKRGKKEEEKAFIRAWSRERGGKGVTGGKKEGGRRESGRTRSSSICRHDFLSSKKGGKGKNRRNSTISGRFRSEKKKKREGKGKRGEGDRRHRRSLSSLQLLSANSRGEGGGNAGDRGADAYLMPRPNRRPEEKGKKKGGGRGGFHHFRIEKNYSITAAAAAHSRRGREGKKKKKKKKRGRGGKHRKSVIGQRVSATRKGGKGEKGGDWASRIVPYIALGKKRKRGGGGKLLHAHHHVAVAVSHAQQGREGRDARAPLAAGTP